MPFHLAIVVGGAAVSACVIGGIALSAFAGAGFANEVLVLGMACVLLALAMHSAYAYARIRGLEGTLEDITAQHESFEALRTALQETECAARAKLAFIAEMGHDLRTPLNAVLGFSDLMLQQLFGPIGDRYRSYLADIHSNGQKLHEMIGDVLDFARVEGGALELSDRWFAVEEPIEAARAAAVQIRNDAAPIVVDLPGGLPLLRGDETRIAQVIGNLLSNAVKFTPADGSIRVKASHGLDGGILVEIVDSGTGMAPDQIARAFGPFRQIEGNPGHYCAGLGLGLPLAKALMQLHGGQVSIASAPGKGTTVTLVFPAERVMSAKATPTGLVADVLTPAK